MLTCGYRVGSSCGLNKIPLIHELRLSLLQRHLMSLLWSTCDVIPTFHCLVRVAVFLHALTVFCVRYQFPLKNMRVAFSVRLGCDASRLDTLCVLD